ncbi:MULTISPECIES: hypothetical protein [Microbacterium]|uniref:hypothetical protein n=1 Tax=Microbacterium TaxID=33882 RepID=UPI0027856694|nr:MULTISPECIES: hypothetical protein [Microbacterium]MDQ1084944.1 hypothetical protein [Microbacterium sp. SORGH_AS_0344]MDQ1169779.1 hypothetical protein [Microbacterium proteolyticum]
MYTIRSRWEQLAPWERYLARVHAFATSRRDAVFSHESAAALLGLPIFGHPRAIHIFDGRRSRSARYGDVTVHTSADERRTCETAGIRINAVEDVVVDLARALPPALAVAVADAAARMFGLSASDLLHHGSLQRNAFGLRRMTWALSRCTPLSESVGESISRVVIEWCGFPRPTLQMEHRLDGHTYRSDFCWPEQKVIGESDGWVKYRGDEAAETLRAEKRREDALRRAGWHIARWDYAGALGVEGLRSALLAAGLIPMRREEAAALASVGRNARSV